MDPVLQNQQTDPIVDHNSDANDKPLSKSAQKKMAKQNAKAEKQAAKAAKAVQLTAQPTTTNIDTSSMTEEAYAELRQQDLAKLTEAGLPAYCYKFDADPKYSKLDYETFVQKHSDLCADEEHPSDTYYTIGRISRNRRAGPNLSFVDIRLGPNTLQMKINRSTYDASDLEPFALLLSTMRIGDIWGFAGHAAKTKAGELSLYIHKMRMLVPCVKLLPPSTKTVTDETTETGTVTREISGLTNPELRYRMRELDLIINPHVMRTFQKRSNIILAVESFLQNTLNLIRVETPILVPSAGGATAKPFTTESFDYKCELVLRIATELYLKRLIVGGFPGVYEIGKQFRNESNDLTHNSEFTSLEYYIINTDYHDLMAQCQSLITHVVQTVCGSLIVEYDNKQIDFTPPYKSYDMLDALHEFAQIDVPADLTTDDARSYLDAKCIELNVECAEPRTTARLLDKLVGTYIESRCINPTFITGHPSIMSPLAKPDRFGSQRTERFELFVNCTELANAYTELNDPRIQKSNFDLQAQAKTAGDAEAMPCDAEFVESLEIGLPPTGGFGMGIDRLTMFLTNNTSIREVILFPTMKPGPYARDMA